MKIPEYLGRVDIGLLPLIQDTQFNKAKSPTKLFEYMAMRKPIVSSDIGEASRIIQDGYNGLLAKDKKEFIIKMEELIRDNNLRQKLGRNARRTVDKDYSLAVLGKRLFEILREV